MGVFGEIEGMISPPEGPLEVAQERIDRAKLGQSDAGFAAPGDHALVLGADDLDGPEEPRVRCVGRGGMSVGKPSRTNGARPLSISTPESAVTVIA